MSYHLVKDPSKYTQIDGRYYDPPLHPSIREGANKAKASFPILAFGIVVLVGGYALTQLIEKIASMEPSVPQFRDCIQIAPDASKILMNCPAALISAQWRRSLKELQQCLQNPGTDFTMNACAAEYQQLGIIVFQELLPPRNRILEGLQGFFRRLFP
ncbi:MAG: hypothetical protein HY861_04340 [Chlamydiia bacterium]|nr:hypothetical protein [Chlamydiia bacterium]